MRLPLTLAVLAAITFASGCTSEVVSDSTSDKRAAATTSAVPTPLQVLEKTARSYAESYYDGDSQQAFDLLAERCQANLTQEELVDIAETDRRRGQTVVSVRASVEEDVGAVEIELSADPDDLISQRWEQSGTRWRLVDCPDSEPVSTPAPGAKPAQPSRTTRPSTPRSANLESSCSDMAWREEMGLEGDRLCGSTLYRDGFQPGGGGGHLEGGLPPGVPETEGGTGDPSGDSEGGGEDSNSDDESNTNSDDGSGVNGD